MPIEIITQSVIMPSLKERRYQYKTKNNKWYVIDTDDKNSIVYSGGYKNVMIAYHNLNKKHYLQLQKNNNE